MIYSDISNIPINNTFYIVERPNITDDWRIIHMNEPFIKCIKDSDTLYTEQTGCGVGQYDEYYLSTTIIADSIKELKKAKFQTIYNLRVELETEIEDIKFNFYNSMGGKTKYLKMIKKYPEILI
jgi:hypothetical protein